MSFYVVPMIGVGTRQDPRRPKYIAALGVQFAIMDMDTSAVVWADTTPAQEAAVGANSDALVVPPLDNTVALNATKNALEALNIPAQWVTAGMTYRNVLRVVCGMAALIQRTDGLGAKLTLTPARLDLTMAQIPANLRQSLADASDSLGLDRSSIVNGTTVRAALKILGQQFLDGIGISLGDL